MKRSLALVLGAAALWLACLAPALAQGPNMPPAATPVAEKPAASSAAVWPQAAGPQAALTQAPGPQLPPASEIVKIDPELLKALLPTGGATGLESQATRALTYLVILRQEAALGDLPASTDANVRREIVARLQKTADESQPPVKALLGELQADGHVSAFRSYWVFNGLAVDGDLAAALALAQLPEVESIQPNRAHQLSDPRSGDELAADPVGWNITATGAPEVWADLGVTGRGVVVANMDSGVDWQHPALTPQYRGYLGPSVPAQHDYNWFDATGTYPTAPGPNRADISRWSDHGTHTMGSLVGREANGTNAIGMAPGARWVGVKVFDDEGNSTDEWIHAGFQWCLAPTDLAGRNPDPSKAPDVVSNSWGDDNGLDDTFRRDLAAWRQAGIFSAWASGNAGPNSGTVGSPASYDIALAVGAVDVNNGIASFSSRGPSPWGGLLKPDIVAPGVNIRSAVAGGGYESGWNGTSMATPHVAGLAALMIEAARHTITVSETERILRTTARDSGPVGPDNAYGYGRIDAVQAVSTVFQGGAFSGQVVDVATGQPLPLAQVRLVRRDNGGETQTTTDGSGSYTVKVAAGVYDVTAYKFGYQSQVVRGMVIVAGYTTQLRFGLVRLPSGTLRGTVRERATGAVVAANVILVGTEQSVPLDAAGRYTVTVPVGSYTLRALPAGTGHRGAESSRVAVTQGATVVVDLTLEPASRLLLVEADAWTMGRRVQAYYRTSLDNLLWGYDVAAAADLPNDTPNEAQLALYDAVIWAQAVSSPSFIGAWPALTSYLAGGGRLLISGQDIGYWDAQQNALDSYQANLHARYLADHAGLAAPVAAPGGLFDGLQLQFNTADSAANQIEPDAVAPADALADTVLGNSAGQGLGLQVSSCQSRVVYLSFGLEGVGPEPQRRELLSRALAWLGQTPLSQAAHVSAGASTRAASPGEVAKVPVSLVNRGTTAGTFDLRLTGAAWPARLVAADTGAEVSGRLTLGPCQMVSCELQVSVPSAAGTNQTSRTTIRLAPTAGSSPAAEQSVTTLAMPAWQRGPAMPTPRFRLSAAAMGCKFYAIGGFDLDNHALAAVQVLDTATGIWSSLASRPSRAANSAVAVLNGTIYLIGGYDDARADGDERLATVEAYDLATNTWRAVAALPQATSGMTAVVLDGRIWAMGGNTADGDWPHTLVYDPSSDAWSPGPDLPTASPSFAQATVMGGRLYLAGGWPSANTLYVHDPASGGWQQLASMRDGRHSFGLVQDGAYLYVAGGGNEWQAVSSAERYDPVGDAWITLPLPLTSSRVGAVGALVDGRFLLVGGTTAASGGAVETLGVRSLRDSSTLSVSHWVAQPGEAIDYTMQLHNPSRSLAQVIWALPLPRGLTLVGGSASPGMTFDQAQATLGWTGTLEADSGRTLRFSARLGAELVAGERLTATATLDDGRCAVARYAAYTLVSEPGLTASTKTVDKAQALPGDVLHYTVIIANATPFTIPAASLVDPLPGRTTLVAGTLAGANYNAGLKRVEWSGELTPGYVGALRFAWVDGTAGVPLDLGDDECSPVLDVGFDLTYYGRTYSQMRVSSNGLIQFEGCTTQYANVSIPNPSAPNSFLAPFWDDLAPNTEGAEIYVLRTGTAPHRQTVIEWYRVPPYGQTETLTFEAILYEGTNRIVFQYLTVAGQRGTGDEATIGIESPDGSQGVLYLYEGQPADHLLRDGLAIEMVHSSTLLATTHQVSYDVRVDDDVPPRYEVTNTAFLDDGRRLTERQATTVIQEPDLAQSAKTCSVDRALQGSVLDYWIHVTNDADVPARQFRVIDQLPPELTLAAGSLTGGATYVAASRQIVWQGELAGQATLDIRYRAQLAGSLAVNQRITNTATLEDRGVVLRTLAAGVVANPVDLNASSLSAGASQVKAGDTVAYAITVRNDGLSRADTVLVSNTLPSDLMLQEGTLVGGSYDAGQRRVTWSGALDAGAARTITYQARVSATAPNGRQVVNRVVITAAGQTLERQAPITVQRADLRPSTIEAQPGRAMPGTPITFTLKIANSGAYDIAATLVNEPPTAIHFDPASLYASDGQVNWDGQRVTWQGTVASKGLVQIVYTGMTASGLSGLCITNRAVLTDAGGIVVPLETCVVVSGHDLVRFPLVHNRYRAAAR